MRFRQAVTCGINIFFLEGMKLLFAGRVKNKPTNIIVNLDNSRADFKSKVGIGSLSLLDLPTVVIFKPNLHSKCKILFCLFYDKKLFKH